MKKAEERALEAYPVANAQHPSYKPDNHREGRMKVYRKNFVKGYEQAAKDVLATLKNRIDSWLPDYPERTPEDHAERTALFAVKDLITDMEKEYTGEPMDKATRVAIEKYPHSKFEGTLGDSLRAACAVGYMQAEKDSALTVHDIFIIHSQIYAVQNNKTGVFTMRKMPDEQYQEILDKFNEWRNK